jgi:serine/threonine protein kinase
VQDASNDVKIADFGWSTVTAGKRTTFCGTLDYLAPEVRASPACPCPHTPLPLPAAAAHAAPRLATCLQMLGESYDYRVDIWSLGVLMFELLTGKAPFDAEETEETQQKIRSDDVVFPAGDEALSAEATELLTGLLQKDPEKRLGLPAVLAHSWITRHVA